AVAWSEPSANAASSWEVARTSGTPLESREMATGARSPRSESVSAMLERQCYHGRMRRMLALLLMMVSCSDNSSAPPGGPDGPISDAPPPDDGQMLPDGQMMSGGNEMDDAHFIDGPCDETEASPPGPRPPTNLRLAGRRPISRT